jgi:hypothetical protein
MSLGVFECAGEVLAQPNRLVARARATETAGDAAAQRRMKWIYQHLRHSVLTEFADAWMHEIVDKVC